MTWSARLSRLAERARRQIGVHDAAAWGIFARYYRPHARALVLYGLLLVVHSLIVLVTLVLIRQAFDVAIPGGRVRLLVAIGAGVVVARALQSAIGFAMRLSVVCVIKSAVRDLRQDVIAGLYTLSRDFHSRKDPALIHTWVVQETERADNLSNTILSSILPALVSSLVLAVLLFVLSWRLLLLMSLVAPLIWITMGITGRRVRRGVEKFQRSFETFSRGVSFVLHHVDLTFVQGFERDEARRQARHIDDLRVTGVDMAMGFAMHHQIQQNVVGVAGILILVAGGTQVALGALSIGQFLVFFLAASLLNGYVTALSGSVVELVAGNQSLSTLRALMEGGPGQPYSGTRRAAFTGHVELRDVAFAYGEDPVLRRVDLDIRPGARIAIVGPNGAGKSTIFNLILGLYRPRSGHVLADGQRYDDLDLRALRREMGVVQQRPTFFTGTVLENLTYGRPGASREEIDAACALAGARDLIAGLPDGYDTHIGERGVLLSGGECQRISIARALLGKPKLLMLDEPTIHLDTASVEILLRALFALDYRPAVVVISHDERVASAAGQIYRLDGGSLTSLTDGAGEICGAIARGKK